MNIELITDFGRFVSLEKEWNSVLKGSNSDNPFLTFEWLRSWLEVFGDEVELYVIAAREGSSLVGLAPLVINRGGELVFIGYPLNDYSDIIALRDRPDVLAAIIDHILSSNSRWNKVILDQMTAEGSSAKGVIDYLREKAVSYRIIDSDSCPAMILADREAARKMYYKRNITTYVNWFRKQGDLQFRVYEDTKEATDRLNDLFEQHRKRRALTPFPSQFESEKVRRFFMAFLAAMHPKKWIVLAGLTLDDFFLALYLSFEYDRILYLYTTSFDVSFSKRSPGQVILRHLFDYALDHNIAELDFARGGESYKDRFSNIVRQNKKIIIYNSRLKKTAADLFHSFRYSKMVDLLYRNKRSESARMAFLFHRRKSGTAKAVLEALRTLFGAGKK